VTVTGPRRLAAATTSAQLHRAPRQAASPLQTTSPLFPVLAIMIRPAGLPVALFRRGRRPRPQPAQLPAARAGATAAASTAAESQAQAESSQTVTHRASVPSRTHDTAGLARALQRLSPPPPQAPPPGPCLSSPFQYTIHTLSLRLLTARSRRFRIRGSGPHNLRLDRQGDRDCVTVTANPPRRPPPGPGGRRIIEWSSDFRRPGVTR
jgi:hypothetical protein